MTKKLFLRAFLTTLFSIAVTNAHAQYEFNLDGIDYSIINYNEVTVQTVYPDILDSNEGAISIPSSVTYEGTTYTVKEIHMLAFQDCQDQLREITIPASIVEIGTDAFVGCSNLERIVVEDGNTIYDSREQCNAIIQTNSNTLIVGCRNSFIPNTVTTIGSNAFKWSSIETITIPSSVTMIGKEAFANCEKLLWVTFDNCPAAILESAFEGCSELTTIIIPEYIVSIDKCVFKNCTNLKTVIFNAKNINSTNFGINTSNGFLSGVNGELCILIDESVTNIPNYLFYLGSTPTKFISLSSTPPTCESSYTFSNWARSAPLYVPVGSTYSTTDVWKDFNNIIPISEPITQISLDHSECSIDVWERVQLTATVTPTYATINDVLLWTSSNPDVAVVDADGLVTGLTCGHAEITATACDGTDVTSASCHISVGIADDIDDIDPDANYINFELQGVRYVNGILYACSTAPTIHPSEPNKTEFESYEDHDVSWFDQRDWLAIKCDNDYLVGKTFTGFHADYDGTYLKPTSTITPSGDAEPYALNTFKVANVFYGNYEHTDGLFENGYKPFFMKAKVNEVGRFVGMINESLELTDAGEIGTYLGSGLRIDANGWTIEPTDVYKYFEGVLVPYDMVANGLQLIMLGESSIWSDSPSVNDYCQDEDLMIYDISGRLIKRIKSADTSSLDMPAGYYIVRSATSARTVTVR